MSVVQRSQNNFFQNIVIAEPIRRYVLNVRRVNIQKKMVNLEKFGKKGFQQFSLPLELLNNIVKNEENQIFSNILFFFQIQSLVCFTDGSGSKRTRAAICRLGHL